MGQEVSNFRTKYLNFLKNNNFNRDLCKWLESATDFEGPDGYYYDKRKNTLILFEHFEIDCSELIIKNNKAMGSRLQRNSNVAYQETQKEIQTSKDNYYETTKVIEQGCYKEVDNKKVFVVGENGDKYRDYFINSFKYSFNKHISKIESYKQHLSQKLSITPTNLVVVFLVEDKTNGGTYFLKNKNMRGAPVILTNTLQFQELVDKSDVDYVLSAREYDKTVSVGYKGDCEDKIDLKNEEFYIIPAIPYFIATIKHTF